MTSAINPTLTFNRKVKAVAYHRTLSSSRKQLSPLGSLLSQILHQPLISSLLELIAQTVGRSRGLLWAGALSAVGSPICLMICDEYGYTYDHRIYLLLFIVGYLFGCLEELVRLKLIRQR